MATLHYVQNDTAPSITFNVARNGVAVDLTGATVQFKIMNTDTNTRTNDANNTCVISTPATSGIVTYNFSAGDIPLPTTYSCDLVITYSNGKEETAPTPVILAVRAEA